MGHKSISNKESYLRTHIERLGTDLLFECFVGLLLRNEAIGEENIHVIPKENHKRNYKNDIIPAFYKKEFEPEQYFEKKGEDITILYTSRNAILDYIPEDIYSEPDNVDEFFDASGKERNQNAIEEYREKLKEEQESVQRFFRPLEIEYNKLRIKREMDELDKIENFNKILKCFWGDYSLESSKWKRFVQTLHLSSSVIGDPEKTKALIEFVLDTEVTLIFSVDEYCIISEKEQKELTGETRLLGYNVVVGGAIYDYLEVCTLTITNLSNADFLEYFKKTSDHRKLLNEIIKYYFPLNTDIRLDFTIKPPSKEEEKALPILGYSSKLGN